MDGYVLGFILTAVALSAGWFLLVEWDSKDRHVDWCRLGFHNYGDDKHCRDCGDWAE